MSTAQRRDRLLNRLYRGASTVPSLSQEFAISERTLYRDIAALRDAGHTIRASPGPGGGVSIDPDSRPRPVHFEVDEIVGLALSVAMLKAMPHVPFVHSAQAALDRARRALSRERQRAIARLQQRVLVAEPASEAMRASMTPIDPELLTVFERCFTESRLMRMGYTDRFGAQTQRRLECVALVLRAPVWYVVAWDLDKDAARVFRMDGIREPVCGGPLAATHAFASVTAQVCPDAESVETRWIGRDIA